MTSTPQYLPKKVADSIIRRTYETAKTACIRAGGDQMCAVVAGMMAAYDQLSDREPYGTDGPHLTNDTRSMWTTVLTFSREDLSRAIAETSELGQLRVRILKTWNVLYNLEAAQSEPGIMFAYLALRNETDQYVRVCLHTRDRLSSFLHRSGIMSAGTMRAEIEAINTEYHSKVAAQLLHSKVIFKSELNDE